MSYGQLASADIRLDNLFKICEYNNLCLVAEGIYQNTNVESCAFFTFPPAPPNTWTVPNERVAVMSEQNSIYSSSNILRVLTTRHIFRKRDKSLTLESHAGRKAKAAKSIIKVT